MTGARTPASWAGGIALCGIGLFLLAGIGLHLLRPDLDWVHAQMSLYLLGPEGRWLQAGYCAMAVAIVVLGLGLYRALAPPARSAAPLLLFVLAALSLCVTAFAYTDLSGVPPSLTGWVHGVSAQAAFLCLTTAMLLQSWRLRADRHWRRSFGSAFALAAVAFAGIWVLALWRELPRGLAQKSVILVIGAWLATMAFRLCRGSRDGGEPDASVGCGGSPLLIRHGGTESPGSGVRVSPGDGLRPPPP